MIDIVATVNKSQNYLIESATELFLGRGYGAVGTAELCQSAGVNKGTFYHFFNSKAALLAAVIARYSDDFGLAFEAVAQSNQSPQNKLTGLFGIAQQANQSWKDTRGFAQGCLVGNMTLELGGHEPEVRAAILLAFAKWKSAIRPILLECRKSQRIMTDPSDPQIDTDADRIISLLQGGLLLAKTYDEPKHIGAMAPVALAMMFAPTVI